jgi:hypothetical protein
MQWAFPDFTEADYGQPIDIEFGGSRKSIVLNPTTEYRTEDGGLSAVFEAPNKDLKNLGPLAPGQIGYGAVPANLTSLYPNPFLIKPAPYDPMDIPKFAQAFGNFNRQELLKNYKMSQRLALDTLDTELAGMQSFVPAAAALARRETAIDNIFNQLQRTSQIDAAMPGTREALAEQTQRAQTLAKGRLPDEIEDRAFELTGRSAAADQAVQGGFGASSSVARKVSDLMSADRRLQLSEYGDKLLQSNITTRSQFELAPTAYSTAGSQIRVMPSQSASQLMGSQQQRLDAQTMISTIAASQLNTNERQFLANLIQRTNEFNANNINNFALGKFSYMANLAGAYAGALQTDINTILAIEQQRRYEEIAREYEKKARRSKDWATIGQIAGAFWNNFGDAIIGWFSGDQQSGFGTPDFDYFDPEQYNSRSDYKFGLNSDSGKYTLGPKLNLESQVSSTKYSPTSNTLIKSSGNLSKSFIKTFGNTKDIQKFSLQNYGKQALKVAGISNEERLGFKFSGYNAVGEPTYSYEEFAKGNSTFAGKSALDFWGEQIAQLIPFNTEDLTSWEGIKDTVGDISFINSLTSAASNNNYLGFLNLLKNKFNKPVIEWLSGIDPARIAKGDLTDAEKVQLEKLGQNSAGISGILGLANMFLNWGNMSTMQKGLALANNAMKLYHFADGTNLFSKQIMSPNGMFTGMNLGQAMDLISNGYNAHNLIKNWDQLNAIGKILGTGQTIQSIVRLADNLGLLSGSSSSAVSGLTAPTIESASRIAGGAGAAGGAGGAGGAGAAGGAGGAGATSGLQVAGGALSIASGLYTIYNSWGTGGVQGGIQGAIGAAGVSAGMTAIGMWNPYVAAAIAVTAIAGGAVHTGKSKEQLKRDLVRNVFKELGVTNDRGEFELPDGTIATIGKDGKSEQREVKDRSKFIGKDDRKLNPYDTDYTNDLDFMSSMFGITLSRVLSGAVATNVNQVGSQMGNALLANIGTGKELTKENFDKLITNARAIYAKAGIKSREDLYQLANLMFKEGRINQTQMISMHQTAEMLYGNKNYDYALNLMKGRNANINFEESKKYGIIITKDNKAVIQDKNDAYRLMYLREKYPEKYYEMYPDEDPIEIKELDNRITINRPDDLPIIYNKKRIKELEAKYRSKGVKSSPTYSTSREESDLNSVEAPDPRFTRRPKDAETSISGKRKLPPLMLRSVG